MSNSNSNVPHMNFNMGNNGFMVVSLFLACLLFYLFICLFAFVFDGRNVFDSKAYNTLSNMNIFAASLFILVTYAIGFLFYIISYIVVSLPSYSLFDTEYYYCTKSSNNEIHTIGNNIWVIERFLYKCLFFKPIRKVLGLKYEFKVDSTIEYIINNDNFLKSFEPKTYLINYKRFEYKIWFMYLLLRNSNNRISLEIKFLFNQLVFVRVFLCELFFAFVFSYAFFLYKDVTNSLGYIFSQYTYVGGCLSLLFFIFLILIVYYSIISIYCLCIRFFDRALYGSYILNRINIDNSIRQRNCDCECINEERHD